MKVNFDPLLQLSQFFFSIFKFMDFGFRKFL